MFSESYIMNPIDSIIGELLSFMKRVGGAPTEWYIGLTGDIMRRLFLEHNVEMESKTHISKIVESADTANWVYLHKKASDTNP